MKKLFVVGDSTLAAFQDPYFYPRYGYGTMLNNVFKNVDIINLALSGRSARSFIKETNYKRLIEELSSGDFLWIGFGHNDEKAEDRLRFSDARLPKTNPASFTYFLNEYYLKPAKRVGAIPVLCTPICRLDENNEYTKDSAHITPYGNYKGEILKLGEETNTLVLNLTDATKERFEALGYAKASKYFAVIAGKLDKNEKLVPNLTTLDKTHLNLLGAKYIAYLAAILIQKTDHPLKNFLSEKIMEPTIENFTPNPNYIVKRYSAPKLKNYHPLDNFKTQTQGWYGTAFGASIGDISCSGFIAKEDKPLHFIVGQSGPKLQGQLSLTSDGFAFCFRQIPVEYNFSLSTKARILKVSQTKQSGFGIMLRDDCYINQQTTSELITSNYVAAGLVTTDTSINPIFYKENVTLHKEAPLLEFFYQETEEVVLKLIRIGQSIECFIEYQNKTYEKVLFDFDLLQIDQDYMYLGFFGTKGTLVEFFDVQFDLLGKAQGA